LDDFLFGDVSRERCQHALDTFIALCNRLGIPISEHKIEGPTTTLKFLGLVIDTVKRTVTLPLDKIQKALRILNELLGKRKTIARKIQSLAGLLNFCAKAQPAARAFIRKLYDVSAGKAPHLHIQLSAEVKADLDVWRVALQTSSITIPWIDHLVIANHEFDFFTDASGHPDLGFGILFKGQWCSERWPQDFVPRDPDSAPNMLLLEMIPIAFAVETFPDHFAGKRIRVYTDNQGAVDAINKCSCHCKATMPLIRLICLRSLQFQFKLTAAHIPTKQNVDADDLSRLQVPRFQRRHPKLRKNRFSPPCYLWPLSIHKLKALRLQALR
jgi:hypothetical protein